MKKHLFFAIGLCLSTILYAQVSKTVICTTGNLYNSLTSVERNTVTNLIVTGTIDARDIKIMRDSMPVLSVVDMSGVSITTYTGTQGTYSASTTAYPANTLPKLSFFNTEKGISKTSITSVNLPFSIISIGEYAFYGCKNLLSVNIHTSVSIIDKNVFSLCSSLTSIIIPTSATSIGLGAFIGCKNLGSVSIPASVTYIGRYAFEGCSGLIVVDDANINYSSIDGVLYNKAKTKLIQCPTSKSGEYQIPSYVTSIGVAAFYECEGLTSIIIPSSIATIDSSTFYDCKGLTSVAIPSSVNYIGLEAFYKCTGLTSITIPSSVTTIGDMAFHSCNGLTSITISSSVTSIGGMAFGYCNGLTSVTIPSSVTSIGGYAFYECTGLTSIFAKALSPVNIVGSYTPPFEGVNKISCTLWVPVGSKSVYQAANEWKKFTNIIEFNNTNVKEDKSSSIVIYPNPIIDGFRIKGLSHPTSIIIYNLKGNVLFFDQQIVNEQYISLKSQPSGFYLVKLQTETSEENLNLIKQ